MSSKKDEILDVAKNLFMKNSYEGTSMDLIAKEMGFTKAALYYHFKSKEEILTQIMERTTQNATVFLEHSFKEKSSLNEQSLNEYYSELLDFLIIEKDVFRILIAEFLKENKKDNSLLFKIPFEFFSLGENTKLEQAKILLHIAAFIIFQSLNEKISNQLDINKEDLDKDIKGYMISLLATYTSK